MAMLTTSYWRRKRQEARLIAVEVGKLFASAEPGKGRMQGHELLAMAGVNL